MAKLKFQPCIEKVRLAISYLSNADVYNHKTNLSHNCISCLDQMIFWGQIYGMWLALVALHSYKTSIFFSSTDICYPIVSQVQREIVAGLKYFQVISRKGIKGKCYIILSHLRHHSCLTKLGFLPNCVVVPHCKDKPKYLG